MVRSFPMVVHSFLNSRHSVVVHNSDVSNRDLVLDKLRSYFGNENVVPISTYNNLKIRSLTRDVGKFYGISIEELNTALRTVEDSVYKATMKQSDNKNLFVLKYEDAIKYDKPYRDFIERHPQIGTSVAILFKQNRSLGRHAGGVLISDDLPDKMPLITSGGEPQSPWTEGTNVKHLEKIGNFIKYDLLGLETLRLIEQTIERVIVEERSGWHELKLDDGTTKKLRGDEAVITSNRGIVLVRDLVEDDDVVSFDPT